MKRYSLLIFILVIMLGVYAQYNEVLDACTSKETKLECKKLLDNYDYDASMTTRITFKNIPQEKEIEVPLFRGEKYRFVFSTEGLPQAVDINVYNKPSTSPSKTLVFTNTIFPETDKIFIFEPEKPRKLFIHYIIPATNDTTKKGCVVFVLGYLNTGIFSGEKNNE